VRLPPVRAPLDAAEGRGAGPVCEVQVPLLADRQMNPLVLAAVLTCQPPAAKQEAPPQTQRVPGLEVVVERDKGQSDSQPAFQFPQSESYVNVRARPAPWPGPPAADKPTIRRVQWIVLGSQSQPKVSENLNPENSVITVGLSDPSVFIAAVALIDTGGGKCELTEHAAVTLAVTTGNGPPQPQMGQGQPQRPAAVPAGTQGLSVVVVCQAKTPEFLALAQSQAVRDALAASGSRLYVMDAAEAARRPGNDTMPHVQAVGLPALIVIGPDRRRLLPAGTAQRLNVLAFDGKNNAEIARRNELILLDMVGRAAGGR
jgi:hypothetical protein